jgi:bacteriocin-like protein
MEKTMSKSDYRSKYHRSELENADGEISEKELTAVIGGRQLPGATTPGKIVLKRGKNSSMELDAVEPV